MEPKDLRPDRETKYTCPSCSVNAWEKPQTSLICGDCEEPMEADDEAEE
jgi:hypothetical protein